VRHEKIPPVPEDAVAGARFMARQSSYSKGKHAVYQACDLCGYVSWASSWEVKEGEEPTVSVAPGGLCPRCQEMASRYPEIVQWVAIVLGYHLERWHDPENVEKSQWALERKASTP
jgi:hypothetical protein